MRKFLLCCFLMLPASAFGDINVDVVRCSNIDNTSDRLDCFDAVAAYYRFHGQAVSQPAPTTPATPAARPETAQSPQHPTSAAATSPETPGVVTGEDAFGKTESEINQLESIKSQIDGEFRGWKKGAIIKLKNGQKWRGISGSYGYVKLRDPAVNITRGILGSFDMKVEGVNGKGKVRRIE